MPLVQQFYHLKRALRGDLSEIIHDLHASAENYKVAWDLITQRCDKPRIIIQTHLKELLSLPEMKQLSVTGIRSSKEKSKMRVNALRALKEQVDEWDSFSVYIISKKKLDEFTCKA